MKTEVTPYSCPVCKSPIWETIYEDNSNENGYACYWGHVFTKEEFDLNQENTNES